MTRYVRRPNAEDYPVGQRYIPVEDRPPQPRKGPMIISDTTEAFRSMADGMYYDSKSSYAKSIKEVNAREGRDYVVIGNDSIEGSRPEPPSAIPDLEKAYSQLS